MTDLRDHEADLDRILTRLERSASFGEILAERVHGQSLRVDRKSTRPATEPRLSGAVLRAWAGSKWVETSTSDLTPLGLERAADAIERVLESGPSRSPPPGPSSTIAKEMRTNSNRPAAAMGVEAMIKLGKDLLAWGLDVKGVREMSFQAAWSDDERLYLNTVGARCYQSVTRVRSGIAPVAFDEGKVEYDFEGQGGIGGTEWFDYLTEATVRATAKNAVDLLGAKAAPTGRYEVLLDPSVSGTFAHESFGHGTEADQFVRDRSYLKPLLGSTVGPEFVTIVDNGAYPGGWGGIYFDDEGNPAQRTVMVDKGQFVGALHDRETAAILHAAPTGNTRRSDVFSRPFVRMTNTYVEPGDWSREELVEQIKDGVILERATSGIEDPLGGQMQLKVKKGHRVVNGKETDLFSSVALSGKVLEFLDSIRGVSGPEDFVIDPGFCGKGHTDLLPAGTGGTYVLATAVVGPA
jgi:TldD protein